MALKVEIYEKDIVRPFSPTPQSLRDYKLSRLDQIHGTHYTPSVFFYSSAAGSHHHDYDRLKESLSKTLSVLYPLAGRVKDGFTIECNDMGAEFVGANVTNYDLADLLKLPKLRLLQQLLPRDPHPMEFDRSQPILAVQVSKFRCGGTCVATCFWHGAGDGGALAGFLQTWAAINRGEGAANIGGSFSNPGPTKTFPPANFDISSSTASFAAVQKMNRGKFCITRFVLNKQEIERIREAHTSDDHRRPTRVEALSAFIWAAVIRATLQSNQNLKIHLLTHMVDLRKRMNPPFPSMCLGNIVLLCAARWEAATAATAGGGGGVVSSQSLTGRIGEATAKVTDEYVRKVLAEGGPMKALIAEMGNIFFDRNAVDAFSISSLCGMPFHETDFGWGNPIWCLPAVTLPHNAAYFYNTTDGGIDVWMGMTPQLMSNLDKDSEFLAHVSFSQIVHELPRLPTRL